MTPSLATDEASFLKIKGQSVQVGEVKAFSNFSLYVLPGIKVGDYPAVLIWCEAFGEFITAAELN
ncbi:MAG: DM13 domain-containing protein [Pseudomonadota bacterium]|nr:DM13 domain-containing protein [Pseudomonadota bacterium]